MVNIFLKLYIHNYIFIVFNSHIHDFPQYINYDKNMERSSEHDFSVFL